AARGGERVTARGRRRDPERVGPGGRGRMGGALAGAAGASTRGRDPGDRDLPAHGRVRGARRAGVAPPSPSGRGRRERRDGGARRSVRRCERRHHARRRRGALCRAAPGRLAPGGASRRRARLAARVGSRAAVTARIAVLAPQVADQIAAGEVVERPASVVKELVENALDGGARAIRVAIENGGKTLIGVSDDGEGMGREDAVLALSRHATSKIRDPSDLIGVATFGFRGEALPALASGARFELETAADGRVGTRIGVVGGKREVVEDAVRQRGTTVTVRALFFNTPARRKFLRAQATETRAVVEALSVLALTRPDIAFTLTSDDRALLDVPPADGPLERLAALWGSEVVDTLLPVAHCEGPLEVRGFAQRPAQARPAGRKGYVFVRGRPIRDPFIVRAAEAGYRSTLAPGDRPSLVLFLDLPGDAVDVNVHPAKLEVRFREKFFVEKVVEEAVRRALGPLVAAAPLGAGDSGLGDRVSWNGVAVPLDMFPADARAPSPEPRAPQLLQVFDTYLLFQTDS